MENDKKLPMLTNHVDELCSFLKGVRDGKALDSIETKIESSNRPEVLNSLREMGLVDHLQIIPNNHNKRRNGAYFLTEKGSRWLRTYDNWERLKFALSRWQLLWGILIGIGVNMLSNVLWDLLK